MFQVLFCFFLDKKTKMHLKTIAYVGTEFQRAANWQYRVSIRGVLYTRGIELEHNVVVRPPLLPFYFLPPCLYSLSLEHSFSLPSLVNRPLPFSPLTFPLLCTSSLSSLNLLPYHCLSPSLNPTFLPP